MPNDIEFRNTSVNLASGTCSIKQNKNFKQNLIFQCDHPGCMGVLRAAAQKQEQQRMATLEILQVYLQYKSVIPCALYTELKFKNIVSTNQFVLQEACGLGDLHAIKSILTSYSGGTGNVETTSQDTSSKNSTSDQGGDNIAALVNFAPNGANTCKL